MQLAGITAMHIAAKFEELFAPEVNKWTIIIDEYKFCFLWNFEYKLKIKIKLIGIGNVILPMN